MKRTLLSLYILHVLNDGYFASIVLILPFLSKSLGFNLLQAGILGSLNGFIAILLAYPAGQFAVKWGGMRVLLYAAGLYSFAYLLLGMANSFYTAFLFFVIASVGFAVFHPIGFGLVAKFSDKKTRGSEIGKFTAIGDVGKMGVSAGLTFIIAIIGWRFTSFLYGAIAAFFLLIFTILHNKNPHVDTSQKPKDLKLTVLLRNKRFLLATAAGTLDVFASFPLFIFLPFLLLEKGFPPSILGTLVGAYFIGNLLGKTILGRSIDKWGHIKIFVLAEVFMALFIVLLALSQSLLLILVFSVILGLLTKGTVPITQTMVTDAVEHHGNFEKSISMYSTIANIAVALSPILLGAISDRFGVTYAFIISAFFALAAIIPALIIPFIPAYEHSKH